MTVYATVPRGLPPAKQRPCPRCGQDGKRGRLYKDCVATLTPEQQEEWR